MNPLFDEALSFVSDTVRRFYAGTGIELSLIHIYQRYAVDGEEQPHRGVGVGLRHDAGVGHGGPHAGAAHHARPYDAYGLSLIHIYPDSSAPCGMRRLGWFFGAAGAASRMKRADRL